MKIQNSLAFLVLLGAFSVSPSWAADLNGGEDEALQNPALEGSQFDGANLDTTDARGPGGGGGGRGGAPGGHGGGDNRGPGGGGFHGGGGDNRGPGGGGFHGGGNNHGPGPGPRPEPRPGPRPGPRHGYDPVVIHRGAYPWPVYRPIFIRPVYEWNWGAVDLVTCVAEDAYADQFPVTENDGRGYAYQTNMNNIEDAALSFCYNQSPDPSSCVLASCTPGY